MRNASILMAFLVTVGLPPADAGQRIFTDKSGRKLTAELQLVHEDEITIKRKDGRVFTLSIDKLSEADQAYAKAWKKQRTAEQAARDAKMAEAILAARRRGQIAEFCIKHYDMRVGDGECWTLANEAYKACGASRPDKQLRVWGRVVDFVKEPIEPGDVVEFRSARITGYGTTGAEHTAVVIRGGRRGKCKLAEQNWGGVKKVRNISVDLGELVSGEVTVYRLE